MWGLLPTADVSVSFNQKAYEVGLPAIEETIVELQAIPGVRTVGRIVNKDKQETVTCLVLVYQQTCIPEVAKEAKKLKYVDTVWAREIG